LLIGGIGFPLASFLPGTETVGRHMASLGGMALAMP